MFLLEKNLAKDRIIPIYKVHQIAQLGSETAFLMPLRINLNGFQSHFIDFSSIQIMEQVISELQRADNWKELMRQSCKNNRLKTALANELTLLKLISIHSRLSKSYEHLQGRVGTVWIENELRTFNWLLIAISGLHNILINDFRQAEWTLLERIFLFKNRFFLKFEAKRLISSKDKNKHWTQQQSQLLRKVVQSLGQDNHHWNDIARKMYELSEQKIFRTGKHCKERWLNYLDPSKERGQWNVEEDLYVLTRVDQSGKKWSQYAAHLSRTEHQVKNRFNSLIVRQKKLTPMIKKEEKLIIQLLKNMKNGQQEQINQSAQSLPISEKISIKKEIEVEQIKKTEDVYYEKPNEQKTQRVNPKDVIQQNMIIQVAQEKDPNQDTDILRYTRDQQEFKNIPSLNEFGIYSPYWNYSPVNNTPANNFMNSPSPLSFFMNSNFTNCFNRFTSQLHHQFNNQEENQ